MRVFLFVLLILPSFLHAQEISNAYFNQPLPKDSPVLFAPGIVSDEFGNRDMAISPAGDELFYTLQFQGGRVFSTILHSKKVNGKWSKPEVASFCGIYNDLEPAFSPDGGKLYFVSNRSLQENKIKDYDIWYVAKTNNGWSNPTNLGSSVNTGEDEFYPSITKSGNIYFTRAIPGREEDIMMCTYKNNSYDTAVSLPDAINSTGDEFNAFIDPDEQFILFTGYKRTGAFAAGDLYISKKNDKGEWMQGVDLGNIINQPGINYCPYITPDKKYFFFTSGRSDIKIPFTKKQSTAKLYEQMHAPLNGADNIYWMETKTILR